MAPRQQESVVTNLPRLYVALHKMQGTRNNVRIGYSSQQKSTQVYGWLNTLQISRWPRLVPMYVQCMIVFQHFETEHVGYHC